MSLSSFKTLFEKVGHTLKTVFGSKATWEQTAIAVLKYVSPLLNTVVALADPAAAPFVSEVISEVQGDLATVYSIASGSAVAPGSSEAVAAQAALSSVQNNFAALLADARIKNSANSSKITAVATTIIGEVQAMLSGLPSASPAPAPAKS